MKGKAHFRLAGLYFKMEEWEKAHQHYNAKEVENLNDRERQTAGEQSAECLANQKKYLQAADEFKELYKVEAYEKNRPFYLVRIGEMTLLADRHDGGQWQAVRAGQPHLLGLGQAFYINFGKFITIYK